MGAFLEKPKTEKSNEDGVGPDYRYVVSSMQGWRTDMEDAHTVKVQISDTEPFKSWSFLAVFDGHAGSRVATHSSENLLQYLLNTQEFKDLLVELESSKGEVTQRAQELIEAGMKTGFLLLDEHMADENGIGGETEGEKEKSGTTAICAILTPEYVFFGNLGDSRGLLGRINEEVFFTTDHKPYLEHERERILKAGGTVMIQRVNGSLAVSRALGDYEYKNVPGFAPVDQLVSPEPDVYVVKRNKAEDQFLVLACDGIFDVMENEELCQLIRSRLTVTDDLRSANNQVLDYCLARGSRDNMTMVMAVFGAAPKKNDELAAAEAKWLDEVKQKANEMLGSAKSSLRDFDGGTLVTMLRSQTYLDSSPVYGGLDLVRTLLDQMAEELKANSPDGEEANDESSSTTTTESDACVAPSPTKIPSGGHSGEV